MGGDYFQEQAGEGLALILSFFEGGLKLIFALDTFSAACW